MAACQGTLLLVDASQGIQAQTVANFYLAFGQGLHVIPVINKIDLPGANTDKVVKQIHSAFELDTEQILKVCLAEGGESYQFGVLMHKSLNRYQRKQERM